MGFVPRNARRDASERIREPRNMPSRESPTARPKQWGGVGGRVGGGGWGGEGGGYVGGGWDGWVGVVEWAAGEGADGVPAEIVEKTLNFEVSRCF